MPNLTAKRVCLITSEHVAFSPRLTLQATALCEAGYSVHVVAGWYFPPFDSYDYPIYASAAWDRTVVFYITGPRVVWHRWRHRIARRQIASGGRCSFGQAVRAIHPAAQLIATAAAKIPADLYIAYEVSTLPAAAAAAKRRTARWGYDATAVSFAADGDEPRSVSRIARAVIEKQLLPDCAYLAAANPTLRDAITRVDPKLAARVVLSTFPADTSLGTPQVSPQSPDAPLKLFWLSQMSTSRDPLLAFVTLLAQSEIPCELHLRGWPEPGIAEHVQQHAAAVGLKGKIYFHPLGSQDALTGVLAGCHWGVSLEAGSPDCQQVLSPQIFVCLAAGLPVILNRTTAHDWLAQELGEACVMLDLDDLPAAVSALDQHIRHPQRRALAQKAVLLQVARRFNWSYDRAEFLDGVAAALHS
jgi:hypothetical protein